MLRYRLIPMFRTAAIKDMLGRTAQLVTILSKPNHHRRSPSWHGIYKYQDQLRKAAIRPVHETVADAYVPEHQYPPSFAYVMRADNEFSE